MSRPLFLGKYEIERTLGEGSYGKVKLAINRSNRQRVALKIINKDSIVKDEDIRRLKNEVRVLHLVRHLNIVRVYEVLESPKGIVSESEFIVGGELFGLILGSGPLEASFARNIFRQLVSAVSYLHVHFIVHRDIKPENILLTRQGHAKIVDFGFARFFGNGEECSTSCGSLKYCAPEVIRHESYQGPEVDIWCLGVTLYAMLNASLPFNSKTNNEVEIIQKICYSHPHPGRKFDKESLDLTLSMLRKNRLDRPTISQVAAHPWVTSNVGCMFPEMPVVPTGITAPNPAILEQFPIFGISITQTTLTTLAGDQATPTHAVYALLKSRLDHGEIAFVNDDDGDTQHTPENNSVSPSRQRGASEHRSSETTVSSTPIKVSCIDKGGLNGSAETCLDSGYESEIASPI